MALKASVLVMGREMGRASEYVVWYGCYMCDLKLCDEWLQQTALPGRGWGSAAVWQALGRLPGVDSGRPSERALGVHCSAGVSWQIKEMRLEWPLVVKVLKCFSSPFLSLHYWNVCTINNTFIQLVYPELNKLIVTMNALKKQKYLQITPVTFKSNYKTLQLSNN